MKCVVCKHGDTKPGTTTVTLDRDGFRGVPAQVCSSCGEAYVDEDTTRELLQTAEAEASAGAQVEVRQYKAA